MFEILSRYQNEKFTFTTTCNLKQVCTAPKDQGGVYLVYAALPGGNKECIYIGCSGKMKSDGNFARRKDGIFGRIVNGHQTFPLDGKNTRAKRWQIWPEQMKRDGFQELEIHWYVTFDDKNKHMPGYVEALLIQEFFEQTCRLPIWNKSYPG